MPHWFVPLEAERRASWLIPEENKDGGQGCPRQGRHWLQRRKGVLRIKAVGEVANLPPNPRCCKQKPFWILAEPSPVMTQL